jgi:hypothetical protein
LNPGGRGRGGLKAYTQSAKSLLIMCAYKKIECRSIRCWCSTHLAHLQSHAKVCASLAGVSEGSELISEGSELISEGSELISERSELVPN